MKTTHKNLDAIPTWKIREILNSFYCTGVDGADYYTHREELESIYWQRLNTESLKIQKTWEKNWKEHFRHQHSTKGIRP